MSDSSAARLLLVDDHAIVRAGYRHLLEQHERFSVIGEAATADEAYAMFRQHRPDVVITDLAMLRAIAEVLAGRHVLSPDIAQALALARLSGQRRPLEDLTPREFDVLCMLVSPASEHEIAQRLHLSVKTIHNLHYQIKSKLGVASDIELTRLALSWGLDLAPSSLYPAP